MNYKLKYLKYKQKYSNLKGGNKKGYMDLDNKHECELVEYTDSIIDLDKYNYYIFDNGIDISQSLKEENLHKNYKYYKCIYSNKYIVNDKLNITGPVSYVYFNILGNNGKEKNILLFGDIHRKYNKYNNYLDFPVFLKKCIELNSKNKTCLDFFMEDSNIKDTNKIYQGGSKTILVSKQHIVTCGEILLSYILKKEGWGHKKKEEDIDKSVEPILIQKLRELKFYLYKISIIKKNNGDWRYYIDNGTKKEFSTKEEAKKRYNEDVENKNIKIDTRGFRYHNWDSQLYIKQQTGIAKDKSPNVNIDEIIKNFEFSKIDIDINLVNLESITIPIDFANVHVVNFKFIVNAIFSFMIGNKFMEQYYKYGQNIINKLIIFMNLYTSNSFVNIEDTIKIGEKYIKQMYKLDNDFISIKDYSDIIRSFFINIRIIEKTINEFKNTQNVEFLELKKKNKEFLFLIILFVNIRLCFTDLYAFCRMFYKFDDDKNRIQNCDNGISLKNILYFGGNDHLNNIYEIISSIFEIDINDIPKNYPNKKEINSNIHKINLDNVILAKYGFDPDYFIKDN